MEDQLDLWPPPRPSLKELGFTHIGRCSLCGVETFVLQRIWSHFGQDGIDHRPDVDPTSIKPWPEGRAAADREVADQ